MLYLYLPNVNLSIDRVAGRVKNGGHNIRLEDIKRRYNRSIENLINDYFSVIDSIICISNENHSELIFNKNKGNLTVYNQSIMDEILRVKNVK
jgi:predicted ABC-type ATPase